MLNLFIKSRRQLSLWLMVTVLLLFWGCSTQKDSFVNRTYHTVTAKYNGYFNAREAYMEALEQLDENHTDNYEEVLDIFRYGNEQERETVRSNMEVAYEKASLVIRRHSMNIRGVERNKWIDESYYLIGRSQFFRQEYNLAILTFEYIIREYDTARSYDSMAWIAKSYHEIGRFDQAQQMLETLERRYQDGLLNEKSIILFRKTYADHHRRLENYQQAARQLEMAINHVDSKSERARLTFIHAQLHEHAGDYAAAQQAYARVLDMRGAGYQMRFQARIGMAMAYDPDVGGGGRIREELFDMLNEDRFSEFRDQIYYALAQLSLREGNEEEAVELFRQSAGVSEQNPVQKGLAHLRLGEIFFERGDYLEASDSYSDAVTHLPSDYRDFDRIMQRHEVLSELSGYEQIIQREDSLQSLAGLSKSDQIEVVDGIINEITEQERMEDEAEQARRREMQEAGQRARQGGSQRQEGGWYFYNANAMSRGRDEFFSRYGDRPLEDYWRISNMQVMASVDMDGDWDDMDLDNTDPGEVEDVYDRDAYLANIPNTEEQMLASKRRMMQAYYRKAIVFRDHLNNRENAIESFEELIRRFPGSEMEMQAYYYLYNLYQDVGDHSRAEQVKEDLIAAYPDSELARMLSDPDYAERIRHRQSSSERLYQESYEAFFDGRHEVVRRNYQALDTLDASRELKARFTYLHALSIGKTEGDGYRQELEKVVAEYEDTPVYEPAWVLLASLDSSEKTAEPASAGESERENRGEAPFESPYTFDPEQIHFFVIVLNTDHADPAALNEELANFNNQTREEDALSVNNVFFGDGKQLITVTNFLGKESSMAYLEELRGAEVIGENRPDEMESFVISVDNYPVLYQEKELEAYRTFFRYYYLEE